MKKNLMFLTLLVSVLMISVVSAGITGYLTRGQTISTDGVTATLQKVDRFGTATIVVETPSGTTEIVRVAEGKTATTSEGVVVSASNLRKENLFKRAGGEISVTPASEIITIEKPIEPIKSGCCECINNEGVSNSQWTDSNEEKECDKWGESEGCDSVSFNIGLSREECGKPTRHTHLSDYRYVTSKLLIISVLDNGLVQGEINCNQFGADYVVLGGGFFLKNAVEKGIKINGPINNKIYLVALYTNAINPTSPDYGEVFATCARIEPTLHDFGLDN